MTSQHGSAIYTLLRLLAACCVVVVGVIAAQLIMQRFELGADDGQTPPPAEPAAAPEIEPAPAVADDPAPAPGAVASSRGSSDSLPYQVQATFISEPPTFSRALLRGPNGQSKWYLAGQEPEHGLVLKEIQKDRVVFTYRGDERVQLLKRDAEETALQEPLRGADAPLPQPYAAPTASPPSTTPPPTGPAKADAAAAAPGR